MGLSTGEMFGRVDGCVDAMRISSCLFLSQIFSFSFFLFLQTGHTALQRASAEGHLEIIKTLVKNGVSVDHQDEVVSLKKLSRLNFFFTNSKIFTKYRILLENRIKSDLRKKQKMKLF